MDKIEKVAVGRKLCHLYNGIVFDSVEEVHVYWWLKELLDRKLIDIIAHQPETFILSEDYVAIKVKQLKAGPMEYHYNMLLGHEYTPDFSVVVPYSGGTIFFGLGDPLPEWCLVTDRKLGDYSSRALIEVKPDYDNNNMTRLFKLNQKWMLDKHGIFVNLVTPTELFTKTFVPNRYNYTDASLKKRSVEARIKNPVTADEFLANRMKYYETVYMKRKRI